MACAGIGALLAETGGAGIASGEGFGTALASELAGGSATVGPEAFLGASGAGAGAASLAGGEGGTSFGGDGGASFNQPLEGLSTEELAAGGLTAAATGGASGAAASGFSFPSISKIGSGFNIASALYGMDSASQLRKLALMQANKATPWASSGGGDLAAQQLMALLSGKTDVSTLPGYAAGKQAVERSGAAQGWTGSGNMMAALQQFGGNFYNDAVSRLSGLAGAQFNPVSAGGLAVNGASNAAATNLAAMSAINKTVETQPAWR